MSEDKPKMISTIAAEAMIRDRVRTEIKKAEDRHNKQIKILFDEYTKHVVNDVDKMVTKLDKKFSEMYGVLVRKFLVDLEKRVWGSEIGIQGLLEETAKKILRIDVTSLRSKLPDDWDWETKETTAIKEFMKAVEDTGDQVALEMADTIKKNNMEKVARLRAAMEQKENKSGEDDKKEEENNKGEGADSKSDGREVQPTSPSS